MPVGDMNGLFELDWDIAQQSQNYNANTSNVYGRLILRRKSGGAGGYWTYSPQPWSVTIHGQTFSGTYTYDFRQYNEIMLWQGTVTVAHNADGSLTVGSSGAAVMNSPSGSATVGRTLTLNTIPRASIATFSHSPVTGQPVTIYTNRASSSFTHIITYKFGDDIGGISNGTTDSVVWTPSRTMLNQIPTLSAAYGLLTVATFNGSTHIGTTNTNFVLTADGDVKPVLTDITLSEATAAVSSQAIGAYVQGLSKLNFQFQGEAGVYGSTIAGFNLTVSGLTYNTESGVTAALPEAGNITVTGTVTDSRGRVSDPITKTISVLAWSSPSITSMNVVRSNSSGVEDADGTYFKVTLNGVVSSLLVGGVQKNRLSYYTQSSPSGANSWTTKNSVAPSAVTSVSTSFVIGTYPETSSFDVRTVLGDLFTTATVMRTVSVAAIALDVGEVNLGVGKFWERGTLDVGGDIYATGQVYSTNRYVIPAVADATVTYVKIATIDGGHANFGDHAIFTLRGGEGFGNLRRTLAEIEFTQRGNNTYFCRILYDGVPGVNYFVVQETAFIFSLWIQRPAYSSPIELTGYAWRGSMGALQTTTTAPGGTLIKPIRRDRLMVPDSFTGGNFDYQTGRMNLTPGSKAWTMNGVFRPEFRAYKLLYQTYTGDENGLGFRFATGGTPDQSTNYVQYGVYGNANTTLQHAVGSGLTYWGFPFQNAVGHSGEVTITEPSYTAGTANQKRARWHNNQYSPYGQTVGSAVVNNRDTTSFDGFVLYLANPNINGIQSGSESWISVEGIA